MTEEINIDGNPEEYWCTIKEYRRINLWARGLTLRWIQKRAKIGVLPIPVKRVLHPKGGKDPMYLLNLTDPGEISSLIAYRKVQAYKKANNITSDNSQKPGSYCEPPVRKEQSNQSRLNISVPPGTPIDIVMQSKNYRNMSVFLIGCLAGNKSTKTVKETNSTKNRYNLCLSGKTYEYVRRYAKDTKQTMCTAFVSLLSNILQENPQMVLSAGEEIIQAKSSYNAQSPDIKQLHDDNAHQFNKT